LDDAKGPVHHMLRILASTSNRRLKDVVVADTKALNFACSLVRTLLGKASRVFILTQIFNA
jgi:hypothetical protein